MDIGWLDYGDEVLSLLAKCAPAGVTVETVESTKKLGYGEL